MFNRMSENMLNLFKEGMVFLGYPVLALLLSLLLTALCIKYLPRFGLVDMPGERRIHRTPKPRGGGLAIIASFFVIFMFYAHNSGVNAIWEYFFQLLPAAVFLGCIGLLDDRFSLSGRTKLLGQVIAALLVWVFGLRPEVLCGIQLNEVVSLAFTVFWIVGFINAFNLIDGMDGLAAGLAVIGGLGMAGWSVYTGNIYNAVIIMIFVGSCCGFLRYNFSPARIFMGDTGSMFLGLFFSTISLNGVGKIATAVSLLVPLLAAGVPFFDVMLAFLRRSLRKLYPNPRHACGIMTADKEHLHHRLLSRCNEEDEQKKQRHVALIIYIMAVIFSVGGFLLLLLIQTMPTVGTISLLTLVFLLVRKFATVEMADIAGIMRHGVRKPRRAFLFLLAIPFWDALSLGVSYLLSLMLMNRLFKMVNNYILTVSLSSIAVMVLPTLLLFVISGVYRMYFLRTSGRNVQLVIENTVAGCFLSVVMQYLLFYWRSSHPYCFAEPVLFTLLSLSFVVGGRLFFWYMGSYIVGHALITCRGNAERPKLTLVVGSGLMCRFYLEYIYSGTEDVPVVIVGIIDDDPILRNLNLYGYRVLGGSADIEQLYRKHRFERVVITSAHYPKNKLLKLENFCEKNNIVLSRVNFEQKIL